MAKAKITKAKRPTGKARKAKTSNRAAASRPARPTTPSTNTKLKVMLSSTVYGREHLIDQMYAVLTGLGYEVWSSHKGTLPVHPGMSPYNSCLAAVRDCDIFFGMINPEYGSGSDGKGGRSITHLELSKAIKLNKPRFILAHGDVVFARRLLADLELSGVKVDRQKLKTKKGAKSIGDLRVIEMYEEATLQSIPIDKRTDNWVQEFKSDREIMDYLQSQFSRYAQLESFVNKRRATKGKKP